MGITKCCACILCGGDIVLLSNDQDTNRHIHQVCTTIYRSAALKRPLQHGMDTLNGRTCTLQKPVQTYPKGILTLLYSATIAIDEELELIPIEITLENIPSTMPIQIVLSFFMLCSLERQRNHKDRPEQATMPGYVEVDTARAGT